MITKNTTDFYQSTAFTQFNNLIHGFTTRSMGDMRISKNKDLLESQIGSIYMVKQIHGNDVVHVGETRNVKNIAADGIVFSELTNPSDQLHTLIGVLTADCVPILFYDPKHVVYGVAHAGWRGTLNGVVTRVVQEMRKLGSDPLDISVAFGPYIGSCCYHIPMERAHLFEQKFLSDTSVLKWQNDKVFLDLGMANMFILMAQGIQQNNIDSDSICSSCNNDKFFSYRKDPKNLFGEMISFVGIERAS